MESVLMPNEIELYVETMTAQNMKNLGTDQWIDWHNRLQKLNQQALVEAAALKEEHVKETLVSFGKANVLIHEAILVNIWKFKVLPKLLKLEPNPESTFIAYSVLYHEAVAVSLLELVMYHSSCCEALEDSAADLLDYVSGIISQLLSIKPQDPSTHKETAGQELYRHGCNLSFDIGIRCLTILRYLSENMDRLPIAIYSRLYGTHDIPVLLSEIMQAQPWIKDGKLYMAGIWRDWDNEQLGQAEAQVWLTLRHILLDPECPRYYPITEGRRNQLMKLLPLLKPTLLDQLSPLIELKQWLCKVSCMEEFASPPKPLLLDVILDIKENILQQCTGKWKKFAEKQVGIIFNNDTECLQEAARKLSDAYNTDLMENFEVEDIQTCDQCGKNAFHQCSKCKKTRYCSRACQVAHWPQHEENCGN